MINNYIYHNVDEFPELSQSDTSSWVMWSANDPCQRPRWDRIVPQGKRAFIKKCKSFEILVDIWLQFL